MRVQVAGQGDRTPGPARPQAIGAPYYVQPTAPQPLNYDAVYEQGQPVYIAWNSGMASCGGFVLSIYHGGSCSSGGLLQSNQQAGWASGTTQIELLGLALDQQYSWKVKPFIAANCGGDPLWPPCAKVKVKKHVAPPAATDQCQEVVFSGTVFKEVHHIEMHAVQGTFDFWYDAINIPDRFIVSYEGEILWNECVAGTDTIPLAYSGSTSIITVTVLPNCSRSIRETLSGVSKFHAREAQTNVGRAREGRRRRSSPSRLSTGAGHSRRSWSASSSVER